MLEKDIAQGLGAVLHGKRGLATVPWGLHVAASWVMGGAGAEGEVQKGT